jgi:uncharacterized protein YqjF (DUF2071 family)
MTEHRPWPLPEGPWAVAMNWHDLLFAHWPVPLDRLRALVPKSLEIDTYDGQAWIGVVPFRMSGVRPRGLPAIPGFSAFPEINVRTYVRAGDKAGVWFFSLDAGNRLAVSVARRWYHLPYFYARITSERIAGWVKYSSRRAPNVEFRGRYRPSGPCFQARPGSLEHWLAESYCLYAVDGHGRTWRCDIHHQPWPLQPAEAEIALASISQVALEGEPVCMFARRQDAVIWPLESVG